MLLTAILALAEGGENIIQPDLSLVLVVIVFIIFTFALNRILFKPVSRVLDERHNLTAGAIDEARAAGRVYQARMAEYETAIRQARAQGYRIVDLESAAAIERRRQLIEEVKLEAAQRIEEAKNGIRQQAVDAAVALKSESRQIAAQIARTLLGRAPGGGAN